ncbi:MAG: bifunctional DNA primase/polymerase, partial [Candidatus Subteraquimicrobiales bacterium]|nr:bifunctional DNA primase/polymerase [Candidatus Subteraquimicrobiales bacterium]
MDIIQQYAQAGYALFPLNGKKPVEAGVDWRVTPIDPSLSRIDFLGNYGVVAGKRLIIDIDVKKGAKGKESFAKLTQDLGLEKGWEKNTFVVRTGTGGYHVYLNMPSPMKLNKHHKDYPGLEFLHGPFYVVGPESIHPDTELAYGVVFGAPRALLDVPRPLLEALGKIETETLGPQPEKGFVDDDPLNIERFVQILNEMPAPSVGSRRDTIYIAGCRGRDLGISKQTCLHTIQEIFIPTKISPVLEAGEVEHTISSVYKYAQDKMGSLN